AGAGAVASALGATSRYAAARRTPATAIPSSAARTVPRLECGGGASTYDARGAVATSAADGVAASASGGGAGAGGAGASAGGAAAGTSSVTSSSAGGGTSLRAVGVTSSPASMEGSGTGAYGDGAVGYCESREVGFGKLSND